VLDGAPALADFLCGPCADHFARVRGALDALGLGYVIAPRLVRGFDYYVRTTFELTTTRLGAQNAVAGGGRYDGLIELLGGPPDGGIGFAIGIERVALLLAGRTPPTPPLALLVPLGASALARLLPVAQAVRAEGVAVDLGYGERKLRAELERANRLGVAHAVIVGDQELAREEAIIREMASGQQRTVPLGTLAKELLTLAGRG
jgi:histidyl-tRNA synthetase